LKPAPFEYVRAATLTEALGMLARHGPEARVIAGGQTLVPTMSLRLVRPTALVDLNPIASLAYIRADSDALAIGAMTRQRAIELSEIVATHHRLFHLALPYVAHFQIRNRGTIGGSLCHNDPASELPAVVRALEGSLVITGLAGERVISADHFSSGLLTTALEPSEILREIRIPYLPDGTGFGFAEVARRHGDFALAGAAAVLHLDSAGRIDLARLVLFGVHEGPFRASVAENELMGGKPSNALWRRVAVMATSELSPMTDLHASGDSRKQMSTALAQRVLEQAWRDLSA
jgi:aerobic carbon-monoxide dehydrogenase medium subunit